MYKITLSIAITLALFSCRKDGIAFDDKVLNHFIIVGHAYGSPENKPPALYEKLVPKLASFQASLSPLKVIFTGDVAYKATAENWQNILSQLDSLDCDFWIAPGNHEFYTSYFADSVQEEVFFTRRLGGNLFIILNTNFQGWTINESQIEMIKKEFQNMNDVKNVFVFTHQLWWSNSDKRNLPLKTVVANSKELLTGSTSFWTDAFPLFEAIGNPVYFFAGDVGAWQWVTSYSFQRHEKYYFYASGVGSGKDDNILHLTTYLSGKLTIEKIDF